MRFSHRNHTPNFSSRGHGVNFVRRRDIPSADSRSLMRSDRSRPRSKWNIVVGGLGWDIGLRRAGRFFRHNSRSKIVVRF